MRIDGAGGCFDNPLYEVDIDVAWNIALLCVNEMGVTMDEQDDAAHQLHFHNKKKIMQLAMQSLDEETVQVIMDSTKERLQIYNWKREDKEVNQFYELFEKKLTEYRAFILCPNCSAKISSLVKSAKLTERGIFEDTLMSSTSSLCYFCKKRNQIPIGIWLLFKSERIRLRG